MAKTKTPKRVDSPDDLCVCHCRREHHAKANQYKYARCWLCYPDCFEFRLHGDVVDGKEVA